MDSIVKLEKQRRLLYWLAAIAGLIALLTVAATTGEFSCFLELPVEAENSQPTNHSPTTTEMKIAGLTFAVVYLTKEVSVQGGVLTTPSGQTISTGAFRLALSPDPEDLHDGEAVLAQPSDNRRRRLAALGTLVDDRGACFASAGLVPTATVEQLCEAAGKGVGAAVLEVSRCPAKTKGCPQSSISVVIAREKCDLLARGAAALAGDEDEAAALCAAEKDGGYVAEPLKAAGQRGGLKVSLALLDVVDANGIEAYEGAQYHFQLRANCVMRAPVDANGTAGAERLAFVGWSKDASGVEVTPPDRCSEVNTAVETGAEPAALVAQSAARGGPALPQGMWVRESGGELELAVFSKDQDGMSAWVTQTTTTEGKIETGTWRFRSHACAGGDPTSNIFTFTATGTTWPSGEQGSLCGIMQVTATTLKAQFAPAGGACPGALEGKGVLEMKRVATGIPLPDVFTCGGTGAAPAATRRLLAAEGAGEGAGVGGALAALPAGRGLLQEAVVVPETCLNATMGAVAPGGAANARGAWLGLLSDGSPGRFAVLEAGDEWGTVSYSSASGSLAASRGVVAAHVCAGDKAATRYSTSVRYFPAAAPGDRPPSCNLVTRDASGPNTLRTEVSGDVVNYSPIAALPGGLSTTCA
jgi:hypothetical protein